MVLVVAALSIGGKFFGAGLGTLMVKMPAADKVPVAIAHIPGGPMGVLLASVAMEAGVIGPQMFVALVVASIVSALLVGPAFTWKLAKAQTRDVSGYFSRERLMWKLCVESREEAIAAMAVEASRAPGMPAAEVIQAAVADRERTMGTGVGRGIAIPHARLDGLPQPLVAVAICEDGIEWDEIDGKPAHLVFLILTSTTDEQDTQLEILGKIARAFSDKGSARRIVGASSADDAWQRLTEAIS